jgi:hypothetical protein
VVGAEQVLASKYEADDAAAAPEPTYGEGWSTTKFALIAAAGTAGITGVFLFGKASGKKG